jgi:hypothetical protein
MQRQSTWQRTQSIIIFPLGLLLAGCDQSTGIRYELPRAGQVSMAVYDSQGHQVRTLLAGEPQAAGKHSVPWDGLDRAGNPMPIGNYTWKLLLNNGLEADYLSVIGQNPIDPAQPWVPTVGSHEGPSSVALGAGGALYQGSRNSEGPPVLMKLGSETGPMLWTRHWQTKGPIDMVEIGKSLFILGWDSHLQQVDAETGSDQGASRDVLWPGDARPPIIDPLERFGIRVAADGGSLMLAYRDHNTLRWLNPTNGAVLREVAVAQPKAVAAGQGGTVYVLSGKQVLSVAGDGKIGTVVGDGVLADPVTLSYDRMNNQLLVADGGADQRIRRFALDGKPLATYGRAGGRRDGAYEPGDFKGVTHLTCDNAGGFYAVEPDSVRRIVHIAPDGKAAKQWFGGAPFFMVASADKVKPNEVWYSASYDTMAVANLDLETGAWTITQSYSFPGRDKGFGDDLFPSVCRFPVWRVRHQADITYLIHESPAAILRVDEAGRRLVPVALASHKAWGAKAYPSAAINAAMAKQGLTYDDLGSDAFTWSDTNGNGELDPEEFRFHNVAAPVNVGKYCAFDDQFNIYIGFYGAPNYTYTGKRWMLFDFERSAYVKLPNLAAPGSATPVWDWRRMERSLAKVPSDVEAGATAVRWDPDGGVTLALNGGQERHGLVWPDGQSGCSHLLRALPDGTAWTVSKHDSPGRPPATVLRSPGYFPGLTHGCIIACDRNYYGATAWTEDGLYAGFFLDRHADDLPAWAYHPYGRGLNGLFGGDDWECAGSVTDLPDGSVLWMPRSSGRSSVFRVRGWDNWHRDSGKIELTQVPPAATPDGKGLAAACYRGAEFAGVPVTNRVDARLWFQNAPGNDRVTSWAKGPCAGIAANEPFSIRWTGRLVAPLGEAFWFRVYNEDRQAAFFKTQWWKDGAGFARVWLNGVLVIDRSKDAPKTPDEERGSGYFEAGPIRLEAGRSYDLKVEYTSPGVEKPEFALSWASNTKEWERIPPAYFHADAPPAAGPVVSVATEKSDGATNLVVFGTEAPVVEALKLRYRTTGVDYVTRPGEVVIAKGARSAAVAVSIGNGPVRVVLEPGAAYRGDGTAGAVTVGRIPSVTNGLVSAYLFDEVDGRVMHDSVSGRDGKFENFQQPPVPLWQPTGGKHGGALEFLPEQGGKAKVPGQAMSDLALQARLPGVKVVGDFTTAFWVRTRKATQPLVLGGFDLWLEDGRPQLNFVGWPLPNPDGARLNDGEWHHFAFTWDQSGGKRAMTLYVDGRVLGTRTGPGEAGFNGLMLGRSNSCKPGSAGPGFIGVFDDVRIYNRCLSAGEVASLATSVGDKHNIER